MKSGQYQPEGRPLSGLKNKYNEYPMTPIIYSMIKETAALARDRAISIGDIYLKARKLSSLLSDDR
jgi:hypothetical protein